MILDKARLKLDTLEREVEELRAFIKTYNMLVKSTNNDSVSSKKPNIHLFKKIKISSLPNPRLEIIAAAREALRAASPSPILIGDLYDRLVVKGLNIGGKNPKGNLSAKLSQPTDLVYVKNEGWYYRPAENEEAVTSSDAKVERAEDSSDFLNPKPSPDVAQD